MIRSEIEEVRDMLSELCWVAQAYEAKEFGGDELEDAIDDRTKKILALITRSNQELLSRIERELPEKHEQKLSDPRSPNYNKDKGRFYRNGGRNFVIDQIKATIAKIRGEV